MDGKKTVYDLDERTYQFALGLRRCIGSVKWTREQWTDVDQVLRSSGSVAAHYIEINNAVSRADVPFRIRIAKKEARECCLWLRLIGENSQAESVKQTLVDFYQEADELTRILATILRNSQE